jgi:nucleoid-associated protein YejK
MSSDRIVVHEKLGPIILELENVQYCDSTAINVSAACVSTILFQKKKNSGQFLTFMINEHGKSIAYVFICDLQTETLVKRTLRQMFDMNVLVGLHP